MKRRDARESAFQLIFEKSFQNEPMQELLEQAEQTRALEVDQYARRLTLLCEEHDELIDQKIEGFLTGWKLSRLPKVTLSILRLSFCELLYFPDIPLRVSINEAVELAKKYATEEDASYINGVLGAFVRSEPPVKDKEQAPVEEELEPLVKVEESAPAKEAPEASVKVEESAPVKEAPEASVKVEESAPAKEALEATTKEQGQA